MTALTGSASKWRTGGFFSVFALLLVFTSILGFVFQSNPDLQHQLLNSTLERMPVIGPQISGDIGSLTGSGVALATGLVGALWTGLRVTLAIGNALDRIWAVPHPHRAGFVSSRLRGLLVLASIGTVNVLTTATVAWVAEGGKGAAITTVLSLVGSALVDLVLFAASFRVLTTAEVTFRQVLPGALLATACWLGLQALGGVYVAQVLAGSSQTYGGFAAVVGLLTWLLIAAELILIAAEPNVVLAHRLWPRSLTGELLSADKHALRASARAAQLDPPSTCSPTSTRGLPPRLAASPRSDDGKHLAPWNGCLGPRTGDQLPEGLSAEVGKEISEHRKHGAEEVPADRPERWLSILEAILLSLVALLAAYSGFAAAKWGTESSVSLATASALRAEANRAANQAIITRTLDSVSFNAWFTAFTLGNVTAERLAEKRLRPGYRPAFYAWLATDPAHNPNAPAGPAYMPQYVIPQEAASEAYDRAASTTFVKGQNAGSTEDKYVRDTVFLATVLFLVGISSHFRTRAARYGLLAVGVALLGFSIVQLAGLPAPP